MVETLEEKLGEAFSVFEKSIGYGEARHFQSELSSAQTLEDQEKIITQYSHTFGPEEQSKWYEIFRKSPSIALHAMKGEVKNSAAPLAEGMKNHFKDLVNKLDGNYLIDMAMGVSGKLEKLNSVRVAAKKGDYASLRKLYAETWKDDPKRKAAVESMGEDESLKILAPLSYAHSYNNLLSQFKGENGIDEKSLRKYLLDTVTSLEGDKQKAAYLAAGSGIYDGFQKVLAAEAKKKEDAKKK